ncbi:Uncharacterized protein AB751O23_AG_00090 [Chlamydiales bacterium SCGC AB-751-O23]|jgi:protease IV|nr:Uncharacterized protein AB751O23_AG_00090 [Chlamydiales bacterium SCGC AB-751-O23]
MSWFSHLFEHAFKHSLKVFFQVLAFFLALSVVFAMLGTAARQDKGPYKVNHYDQSLLPDHKGFIHDKKEGLPFILVLDIQGVIGEKQLNKEQVFSKLQYAYEQFQGKAKPQALLLRINTPGGVSTDGHSMYRDLKDFKKKLNIPVFAFVDGLCTSAAFYLTSTCDKVYATNLSLVGNIGAKIENYNAYEGMQKLGITYRSIEAGENKSALHPFLPSKEEDVQAFQVLVEQAYQHLVALVVEGRPQLTKKTVVEGFGANIFTAVEAEHLGLIDGSDASYYGVLKELADQAGVLGDYRVIRLDNKVWDVPFIFQSLSNVGTQSKVALEPTFSSVLQGLEHLKVNDFRLR